MPVSSEMASREPGLASGGSAQYGVIPAGFTVARRSAANYGLQALMRNLIERGVNPNAVPGLLQELAERAQRGIQLAPNLNIAPLQRNTGGTYGFVPGRGFVFAPNPMSSRELQEALARISQTQKREGCFGREWRGAGGG